LGKDPFPSELLQSAALRTVKVGEIGLAYVEAGKGQPVVFVHGIPTDYRAWDAQIGPFSAKYHMIAYSRRLASPNRNREDYAGSTIENNSADLVGLIQQLGLSPVHLVSHSYGGFTAAYCAATNPGLVRTLTLVEPAVSTILLKNRKSIAQLLSLLLRSPSTAMSAARFRRTSLDPALAAFQLGDFDAALRYNLDGIMNEKGAFERLPEPVQRMVKENEKTVGELIAEVPPFGKDDASKISAPTLLLNGENSPKVLHSIVNRLARAIPSTEVATIKGCAHFPHLENPAEFNRVVLGFLGKHS
jgi:pimeloyl-ACP methyl ester carboxylesterase